MQAGQPTQLPNPTSGQSRIQGHLEDTPASNITPRAAITPAKNSIPFCKNALGPNCSMSGPNRLREIARMISTTMSRVPKKSGWKAQGGELRAYLSEDQAVLTEWMREQLVKVSRNTFHFSPNIRTILIYTHPTNMQEEEKAKQTLAAILKDTGLKDDIKKQLRLKLAERLQGQAEPPPVRDSLSHRIIISALKEHLDSIGCLYSSSVLCAESGYQERLLHRKELEELISLPSADPEHSIVELLFAKITRENPFMKHAEVQTVPQSSSLSLEEKFAVMDLEFRRALQERVHPVQGSSHNCTEEKAWYEKQVARFKEFEAHKIKARVGEQWRIKFQAYAADMETNYSRRLDKARQKEKLLVQDLARREKALAEKVQGWEASARSRMELLDMKEAAATRQKVALEAQRKRTEEEAKKAVGEGRDKAREYETLILGVEKRIAYEVGLAKLAMEQEHAEREQQQQAKKRFIEEEYDKLMRIQDTIGLVTKENERLLAQNTALRAEIQQLREEARETRGQLAGKEDRFISLKDDLHSATLARQEIQTALENESRLRKKREEELAKTRKELDRLRANQVDQSEDSIDLGPKPAPNPTSLKIDRMRQQRRKEIERFKLEL